MKKSKSRSKSRKRFLWRRQGSQIQLFSRFRKGTRHGMHVISFVLLQSNRKHRTKWGQNRFIAELFEFVNVTQVLLVMMDAHWAGICRTTKEYPHAQPRLLPNSNGNGTKHWWSKGWEAATWRWSRNPSPNVAAHARSYFKILLGPSPFWFFAYYRMEQRDDISKECFVPRLTRNFEDRNLKCTQMLLLPCPDWTTFASGPFSQVSKSPTSTWWKLTIDQIKERVLVRIEMRTWIPNFLMNHCWSLGKASHVFPPSSLNLYVLWTCSKYMTLSPGFPGIGCTAMYSFLTRLQAGSLRFNVVWRNA